MEDTRNELLMELIDKMQTRLADKAYPSEKPEETVEEAVAEVAAPAEEESTDLSDEDLAALESETGA